MISPQNSESLTSFGVKNNQIICDAGEVLVVLSVARVLPNQRLVCKCIFNDMQVYAKIYSGPRANIHAVRELSGAKYLMAANILTPKLVLETSTQNQPVIVYEAIKDAVNAEDFMRQNDFLARREMAIKLVQTVAQHHNANLMQTDIHLKNFLIADNKIVTIDGDGIVQSNSQRQKQRNLATFLSKFDALDDDFMQETVEAYCLVANQKFSLDGFTKIYSLTQKIRQKTASNYADKKVFRDCTDVKVMQDSQKYLFISRQFDIENQLLDDLNGYLTDDNKNIKNGNTCTIGIAQMGDKKVVIKRYNIKSFWHGLKLKLRQSRAAKSWANAHRLQIYNIATAQPLALILPRGKGLGYFLSEFVDAPDIAEFFANEKDMLLKQLVAYEMARIFYKFSLLKIVHGDCKASNIKIVEGKPVLIDLDSMQAHTNTWWFEKKHIKDLKRFMQNWANASETSAIFKQAFIQAYDEIDDYMLQTILQRAKIT